MRSLRAWAVLALFVVGCDGPSAPTGAAGSAQRLAGIVTDRYDGVPVAGARVRVEGSEVVAVSDVDGRFEIAIPPGGGGALVVARDGYFALTRVAVDAGVLQQIAITREAPGDDEVDRYLHRLDAARALRDRIDDPALRPEARAFLRGEVAEPLVRTEDGDVGGARAALDAPPRNIRIWRRGLDGSSSSCSGRVDVIPFEDYVKGVLPHEWISSWRDESLQAGALAIRTYSWRWILAGGKYDCADLDDTTSSQVYRDDRLAVTSRAVDATSGQGIVRSGSLVSGEYSAEHGSPTADGISDPLCAGRTRSGHGRGMCQWGSQRWAADGHDHAWIAEHYWPGSTVAGGAPPPPPSPRYDATFMRMDHPASMTSGERATAWVELRNDGTATWSLDTTRLGTTMPRDHTSVFFDAENWMNDHRATGADHSDYGPGMTGRFTFMITAPEVTSETVVSETFGLVQEGVTWFGPENIRVELRVRPRATSAVDAGAPGVDGGALEVDGGTTAGLPPPPPPRDPAHGGGVSSGCAVAHDHGGGSGAAGLAIILVVGIVAIRRRTRA